MTTIYAIVHKSRKEAYVGLTTQGLQVRFAQHLRDASNPYFQRKLSKALRHDSDGYDIIECETSEEPSEAQWLHSFIDNGCTMLKSGGCNQEDARGS